MEGSIGGLLVSATLPRWWSVTRNELHAVALYQRAGEDLVTASVANQELRGKVIDILAERVSAQRLGKLEQALQAGRHGSGSCSRNPGGHLSSCRAVSRTTSPARPRPRERPRGIGYPHRQYPAKVELPAPFPGFGTPHPVLAESYACELLNLPPIPRLRRQFQPLTGESWDSSNSIGRVPADEKGYSPVVLNRLVPELTRRMVAIFSPAT